MLGPSGSRAMARGIGGSLSKHSFFHNWCVCRRVDSELHELPSLDSII